MLSLCDCSIDFGVFFNLSGLSKMTWISILPLENWVSMNLVKRNFV